MLINHLKIAYRQLRRSRTFALINVLGLVVSITAFVFITQYISFQLSFDNFHINKDRLYRVGMKRYSNGELVETSAQTFPGVRALLKHNFSDVQDATGFYKVRANTGFLFQHNETLYNESGGWIQADSAFLNVFPSLILQGDANTALKEPNSLIISESMARKLFGDRNPIGQTINRVDDHSDGTDFVVRGVVKAVPINSHFHFSVIQQIVSTWPESDTELWGDGRMATYVTFSDEIDPAIIETKLNTLLQTHERENILIKNYELYLQPVTDIHLHAHSKDELEANGNISLLFLLGGIGLTTLVMAWINYVNLETSRFVLRMKDFGIRRIIGSRKGNLVMQYVVEYLLLTIGALLLSGIGVTLLSPYYADLLGVQLPAISSSNVTVWSIAGIIFLSGSVFVGMYPAIFLLRFNPVHAIKGKVTENKSGKRIRQLLVVAQFTTSISLIAFVLTVKEQLNFMKLLDKGVALETVIAVRNPTAYSNQELTTKFGEFETMTHALVQFPSIRSTASSSAIPGTEVGFSYVNQIKRNAGDPYDPTVYKTIFVSADFISTYNLKLLAGRSFSVPADFNGEAPWEDKNWSSVILNESALRQLGFESPEEALNQEVYYSPFGDSLTCRIVGVIKDYHHEAVKKTVYPTILFHNYGTYQQVYFSIGLNAGANPQEALHQIENIWKTHFPERPFEYFFLDEYYDRQFKGEAQFQKIFALFAGIAIVIACLGVLGMTLFEMNTRLKEISIRKVLGASVSGIILLLSRMNLKLILISCLLATPLIYYLTTEWLSNYPSKIELTPLYIFISLTIVAAMVILVSGIQTIKAATSNPVDHLKSE